MENSPEPIAAARRGSLFDLLKPYWVLAMFLVLLTLVMNSLSLVVPKLISYAIDTYTAGTFDLAAVSILFFIIIFLVFTIGYGQNMLQTYTAERVGRDLRRRLMGKISTQEYAYIEQVTPAKLLTNLTSDVDAVKRFISQAVASIVSSIFVIIAASILLLLINWKLALIVLASIPLIGAFFAFFLLRVRKLFTRSQEVIDLLNGVITETILGAGLIRLLSGQSAESRKFLVANTEAKGVGFSILRLFAALLPILFFITELATFSILLFGGHLVIVGDMSLGNLAAFNSYLAILIFPIISIGFAGSTIAQANASYNRIAQVLYVDDKKAAGTLAAPLRGEVEAKHLSLSLAGKKILDNVSFSVAGGSRCAIIGPTGAGKTQLLHMLIGLLKPDSGEVLYDGKPIDTYDPASLYSQVGFVFQDSIVFSMSLRENIAFSNDINDADIEKAIRTAELSDFIEGLPQKLDTVLMERGTSVSGGQRQRITLARALALNPKILLLDDFTARVDAQTERKIVENLKRNYPDITLISVTQKIAPIEEYEKIVLLMEGEVLAQGTHAELMRTSPEYVQIFESQKSTNAYELQA